MYQDGIFSLLADVSFLFSSLGFLIAFLSSSLLFSSHGAQMVPNFQRRYQVSSNTLFSPRSPLTGTLSLTAPRVESPQIFQKNLSISFIYCPTAPLVGSPFPDQGSNSCSLHREWGVLTAGPPGKSPGFIIILAFPSCFQNLMTFSFHQSNLK